MSPLTRVASIVSLCASCTSSTVRSGLPPGDSPDAYTERWHAAYLFGLVEGSGPYELDAICPAGWSEVSVEPDPFTAVAGLATLFLYAPTRVTIVCAAEGVKGPPPRTGYALPHARQSSEVR